MEIEELLRALHIDNTRVIFDLKLDSNKIHMTSILNVSQQEIQSFNCHLHGKYRMQLIKYLGYSPTLLIRQIQ